MNVRRLVLGDEDIAIEAFKMMAAVFDEGSGEKPITHAYVKQLLGRGDFFAVVAIKNSVVVGGITGHLLPMTMRMASEMFIYDLAVHPEHQHRGVGRALLTKLCELAAAEGVTTSFVPVDDEDKEAIAFYRSVGGSDSPVQIFTFIRSGAAKSENESRER